jgi:hypothetical protein
MEWWEEGSLKQWCELVLNYSKYMDKARSRFIHRHGLQEGSLHLRHHRAHILDLVLAGNTDCLLKPIADPAEGCQVSTQVSPSLCNLHAQ